MKIINRRYNLLYNKSNSFTYYIYWKKDDLIKANILFLYV